MSWLTPLFLTIRLLHVLLAAVWLGGLALLVLFVLPADKEAGPAAAPLVGAIARRGLNAFMGAVGGITVLTGIYLYWRYTGGFAPELSATRSAMVFGAGGIAGIVAVILGGVLVARNIARMDERGGRAMTLPEGPERTALLAESAAAGDRALSGGRLVLALQAIALGCMAIGHYI